MNPDRELRHSVERWVEGSAPPAPWLEHRVIATMRAGSEARHRTKARTWRDISAIGESGPRLRLAAALVALLIAVATVAALLTSVRLNNNPTTPGGSPTTVPTPSTNLTVPFAPSPAVTAANWPPGGPVPARLAGGWQPPLSAEICRVSAPSDCILHLGVYTFQVGEEYLNPPPPGNVTAPLYGNVVVNGSEIDFISDTCTPSANFGFERFTYTLNGNILVLARAPGPGQSNCAWTGASIWPLLAGTYARVSTP
jgi:hypothetical protein